MTFKLSKIKSVLFSAAVLMLTVTVAAAAGNLLGDSDSSGAVNVIDATCIQRLLAEMPVSGSFSEQNADVDGNGVILHDIRFGSMSGAACFVYGGNANGKLFWHPAGN